MATNNTYNTYESGINIKPPKPLEVNSKNVALSWKKWFQQYKWFETASQLNKKPAEIQVATFMSVLGPDAVDIYNSFTLTSEESKNLTVLTTKFEEHFAPKISITFERYVFNKMIQNEEEPFDDFFTRIKNQAKKCEFGTLLDSLIRDKIVVSIHSDAIREKLLEKAEVSLDDTVKICRASEIAASQLKELHRNEETVHAVTKYRKKNEKTRKPINNQEANEFYCRRCGTTHSRKNCPAFNKVCNKCGKKGHLATVCKTRTKKRDRKVHEIKNETTSDSEDSDNNSLLVLSVDTNKDDKNNYMEEIMIENKKVNVKLDTGAQCNVLPKNVIDKLKNVKLNQSKTKKLVSFANDKISVLGEVSLCCIVRNMKHMLSFKVVDKAVCPILGKSACEKLKLILRVEELKIDENMFEGLGCIKKFVYDIDLVENPVFENYAPRKIPHALQDDVKKEIDRMIQLGVIEKTEGATPTTSPMVIVRKKGKIRICLDPTDVNKNIVRRFHPLKSMDEIAAKVQNSKFFTILDCKHGFWQIRVTDRTKGYLTMATPWGRVSFLRVPFGLASAPEIYQKLMTDLLEGCENTEVSMDDVLIHAPDVKALNVLTKKVLKKLDEAGIKLNKQKCIFATTKARFLGHIITSEGIAADPEKIESIKNLKQPTNKTELQRLLGMATYLGKFIHNLSEIN
ncbi:uncharacterized protein K02A2.6-like [Eupeodes corollae]|uniref:uncharacterized protein K02A2.6-like n=1 Tax=Eupeodes corollae TaxID=290404 RepID=UPI002493057A|nr:uncharacterized protein K02A2.6-like [Eupeodes corollae]